jgi:hypothetical protein
MRKIILNSTYEETVRATVLTALIELESREKEKEVQDREKEVKDKEKEVKDKEKEIKDKEKEVKDRENDVLCAKLETESFKGLLQSNALELQNVLNANSLLTPRGFIGQKYFLNCVGRIIYLLNTLSHRICGAAQDISIATCQEEPITRKELDRLFSLRSRRPGLVSMHHFHHQGEGMG